VRVAFRLGLLVAVLPSLAGAQALPTHIDTPELTVTGLGDPPPYSGPQVTLPTHIDTDEIAVTGMGDPPPYSGPPITLPTHIDTPELTVTGNAS
jgi:hypothetical protein